MELKEKLDFSIEEIEIENCESENNVELGCWGDSGSDWANTCKM